MIHPSLPPASPDSPQRRRTLITLAAWASLGSGLGGLTGCGGGSAQDSADANPSGGGAGPAEGRLQAAASAAPLLSVLAGNVTGVTLSVPTAIAAGPDGTVYVVDKARHQLIAIRTDGVVQALAGLSGEPGANDGLGYSASFHYPQGVAVSPDGRLIYVADTHNHTIREVSPEGEVRTLAGVVGSIGSQDSGNGQARFRYPCGLATDAQGYLYVADSHNHCIRRISPQGTVITLAGAAGQPGSEDGGSRSARFNLPYAVAVSPSGEVYVADSGNHTIRVIDGEGLVRTLAGLAGNPGATDGAGAEARFDGPYGIQVDGEGLVYVSDRGNQCIRQIDRQGLVRTLAGNPGKEGHNDGPAASATFTHPMGLGRDSTGTLWLTELGNHGVRRLATDERVSTVITDAGEPDGLKTAARFFNPYGVALDRDGIAYVADMEHHRIRKVWPDGSTTTLAGAGFAGNNDGQGAQAAFSYPQGVAVDDSGQVYVADTSGQTIRKISPEGTVSTLAGARYAWGSTDGTGSAARFGYPTSVAVDAQGQVYVTDTSNQTIRKISPAGVVSTLAGKAGQYGHADGPGEAARFHSPYGLAVDSQGVVFVADYGNHVIRKISPEGAVSTLAGKVGVMGQANGPLADARFSYPWKLALDTDGTLYVVDAGYGFIRKISPDGVVSAVAGGTSAAGFSSGLLPGAFMNCNGLAVRNGRLVFSTVNGLAQITNLA